MAASAQICRLLYIKSADYTEDVNSGIKKLSDQCTLELSTLIREYTRCNLMPVRPRSSHMTDFGHLYHGFSGEECAVDRAHVDIPTLTLGRLDTRQVAHRGFGALYIC